MMNSTALTLNEMDIDWQSVFLSFISESDPNNIPTTVIVDQVVTRTPKL